MIVDFFIAREKERKKERKKKTSAKQAQIKNKANQNKSNHPSYGFVKLMQNVPSQNGRLGILIKAKVPSVLSTFVTVPDMLKW